MLGIYLDKMDEKFTIIVGLKISDFILREVSHPMVRIVDEPRNEEIYFLPFKPSIYEASGEMLFRIEKHLLLVPYRFGIYLKKNKK